MKSIEIGVRKVEKSKEAVLKVLKRGRSDDDDGEALVDCVDLAKFVLEAISEVFPVDKRVDKSEKGNDLGWACVLVLESLIPVVVDSKIEKSRLLVTPSVKERAKEIAETWKASLEERGGTENVKTPDVHTFL
ncbi:hypothetical protein ACE6H2_002834 [Prunus campanulata]